MRYMSGDVLERVAAASDLRRRRQTELSDLVRDRAAGLDPRDRDLLTSVYVRGVRLSEAARLASRPAKALSRRLRRLLARIATPEYAYVMAHREAWPASRRRVATAVFVEGRGLRDAARILGLSLHLVRRHAAAVRDLVEAARAGGRGVPVRGAPGPEKSRPTREGGAA